MISRPIMRYFGGKWKIADWIVSHFPPHRCYIEGFGGGASVLVKKAPARIEIYNDLSSEVVNLFRVLRDPVKAEQLKSLLELTPYSRDEWKACHELINDDVEQARRTLVLAHMSLAPNKALNRKSSSFRASSSGYHCLPQQFMNYTEMIPEFTSRLKGVIIENTDALTLMTKHDRSTTLHYVDPPYLMETRKSKNNFYQHELHSAEEHEELSKVLKSLSGFVILSGYPSPLYRDWYRGWKEVSTKTVNGAGKAGKSYTEEVLWMNPAAAAALNQKTLF